VANVFFAFLSATMAVAVIIFGWFAITPGASGVDGYLVSNYGSMSIGGLTLGQFVSNVFSLWDAAIVICLVLCIVFLFAAVHSETASEEMPF
jgi:hypothetical protein